MNTSLAGFVVMAGIATLSVALSLCWPMLGHKATLSPRRPGRGVLVGMSALLIPLLATSLYALQGSPRALLVEPVSPAHRMNSDDMTQATGRLAQKLKAAPDDLEGWFVLARSYQAMGQWHDAAVAYRQAVRISPADPQLMADLADALASGQGGRLEGEPTEWIQQALRLDPRHAKSRALAAMGAYRQARYEEALSHWEHLAALSPPGSEGAELARAGIARIKHIGPMKEE